MFLGGIKQRGRLISMFALVEPANNFRKFLAVCQELGRSCENFVVMNIYREIHKGQGGRGDQQVGLGGVSEPT